MTTHRLALACADVLALYCSEHWENGICHDCIFQNGKTLRGCQIQLFLGFGGDELKKEVEVDVRAKCEQLCSQKA